jgi:hypothetical protein
VSDTGSFHGGSLDHKTVPFASMKRNVPNPLKDRLPSPMFVTRNETRVR